MTEAAKPVVEPVKAPKMKMPAASLAKMNAWAIAGATFFGYCAIFSAIAGFTKGKWTFALPFFSRFFGSNAGVPSLILAVLFAVLFAVFALVTINKITDAETTKKTWGCISKTFLAFCVVYVIDMVGIVIYSLLSLGRKYFDQGDLWLSSFLPTVILCAGSLGMFFIAKAIAAGKMSMLRMMSFIAIGIASAAFILVFIQTLVNFYGGKKASSLDDYSDMTPSDALDILNGLGNLGL